eukprot:TRINITY_DN2693_c1_g4_i2.p2 TRINITY_DN2693_c1_g4~~TRINITY_DN2693_c1_g4_i2.p2  ORF type:complete len:223 (-),score=-6.99 TRINITY_DN2693_c1_g4_i2:697-1365(-)
MVLNNSYQFCLGFLLNSYRFFYEINVLNDWFLYILILQYQLKNIFKVCCNRFYQFSTEHYFKNASASCFKTRMKQNKLQNNKNLQMQVEHEDFFYIVIVILVLCLKNQNEVEQTTKQKKLQMQDKHRDFFLVVIFILVVRCQSKLYALKYVKFKHCIVVEQNSLQCFSNTINIIVDNFLLFVLIAQLEFLTYIISEFYLCILCNQLSGKRVLSLRMTSEIQK